MNALPQRTDIVYKLSQILADNEKREEISEWAFHILNDDSLRLEDPVILEYLKLLGAVDLPSSDRMFLYTEDDLRHWITEIENR